MEIFLSILIYVISALFVATSLWLSAKLVKVECTFPGMLVIAAVTMLLNFIPGVGWILSLIALYFMLHKWTTAEFWPDAIILVVVAGVIRALVVWIIALIVAAAQLGNSAG